MNITERVVIAAVIAAIVVFGWYEYSLHMTKKVVPVAPTVTLTSTSTASAVSTTTSSSVKNAPTATQTTPQVLIDGQTIDVTLALTPADQERGLGGRTGLASHEGMLFVFPTDSHNMFWMKDMEFSIDMIWFSSNGTVIYIQPNVAPDTYPEAFGPQGLSRYVLEVPANFASSNHIQIGDKAVLPQ